MASGSERVREWVYELEERPPPNFTNASTIDDAFPHDDDDETENDGLPTTEAPTGCLTFVSRGTQYYPEKEVKLRNSLLLAVGFLEIANAGDFAANVFNEIPVPVYAIVFMALGGTLALGMLYFVGRDASLSWHNFRGLLAERRFLYAKRAQYRNDRDMTHTVDSFLDVNFREIGTELTTRIGTDILMGFGAFVIGIGTYMAIGAANRTVFHASNLMTGYIGNAPCAIYGFINLCWSAYVWRRSRRQAPAATRRVAGTGNPRIERLLKMRTSSVQLHAALHGVTGAVAGAASIATSTMWWGYVVLVPCIVASALVNFFWRCRIGYDRPFVQHLTRVDQDGLLDALAYVDSCRQHLRITPSDPLSTMLSDPGSIAEVVEVVRRTQLFEDYCMRILGDTELTINLFGALHESITFDSRILAATEDKTLVGRLIGVAKAVLSDELSRSLDSQERYLLEILGAYSFHGEGSEGKKKCATADKRHSSHNRNAHTDCGRHGNDWLFGGFSFTETLARVLKV